MSLETEIKNLTKAVEAQTKAVEALTAVMQAGGVQSAAPVAAAPVAAAPVAAAPVAAAPVAAAPVAQAAVQMPGLPSFHQPVAAVSAAPALPFSDTQGLVAYTMAKYQALGNEKGALIQNVLTSMGVVNLNDVKPEQFAAYYQGVEAIQ